MRRAALLLVASAVLVGCVDHERSATLTVSSLLSCARHDQKGGFLILTGSFFSPSDREKHYVNGTGFPASLLVKLRLRSSVVAPEVRAALLTLLDGERRVILAADRFLTAKRRLRDLAVSSPAARIELVLNGEARVCEAKEGEPTIEAAGEFVKAHFLDVGALGQIDAALVHNRNEARAAALEAEEEAVDAHVGWDDAGFLASHLRLLELFREESSETALAVVEGCDATRRAQAMFAAETARQDERLRVEASRLATRNRLVAESAYGLTRTDTALVEQRAAANKLAEATELAAKTRRTAEPQEAAFAVHREAERLAGVELERAETQKAEVEKRATREGAGIVTSLCGDSKDHCSADDRRWLVSELNKRGCLLLTNDAPFELRRSIAAEASSEFSDSVEALHRRYSRLPRMKRLETYGLRGMLLPGLYLKATLASVESREARKEYSRLIDELSRDLSKDKDGGRKANDALTAATNMAKTYYQAAGSDICSPKDKALLCAPGRALKSAMRRRNETMAARLFEKESLLNEAQQGAWRTVAQKLTETYSLENDDEEAALEADAARSIIASPSSDDVTVIVSALALRLRAAALEVSGEMTMLLHVQANVADLQRLERRVEVLKKRLGNLASTRPSSVALDAALKAEKRVVELMTLAEAAALQLQESLAAAALRAALGPPETGEATLEYRRASQASSQRRHAAEKLAVYADDHHQNLARSLGRLARSKHEDTATRSRAGRIGATIAKEDGACPMEASPRYSDHYDTALRIRAFEVLGAELVGAGDRWIAAIPCGSSSSLLLGEEVRSSWLEAGSRLGLALLDGLLVVAAVEPAAHAWPAGRDSFAQADGAWRLD